MGYAFGLTGLGIFVCFDSDHRGQEIFCLIVFLFHVMTRDRRRVRDMRSDRVAGSIIESFRPFWLRVERLSFKFCYRKAKSVDGCIYQKGPFCILGTKRCTLALYSIRNTFSNVFFNVLRFLYSIYNILVTYLVYRMCASVNAYENAETKRWRYAHAPVDVSPEEWGNH